MPIRSLTRRFPKIKFKKYLEHASKLYTLIGMNTTNKNITVKLEKVDTTDSRGEKVVETNYEIAEMTNAIILDAKWFGLQSSYRAGDTMTESEASKLNDSKNVTVKVIR